MGRIIIPGQPEPEPEPEIEDDDVELPSFSRESMVRWATTAHKKLDELAGPDFLSADVHRVLKHYIVDGDPRVAIGFLSVLIAQWASREASCELLLTQLLNDISVNLESCGLPIRTCRLCQCSFEKPCRGGCWWIDWDVCSACAEQVAAAMAAAQEEGAASDG